MSNFTKLAQRLETLSDELRDLVPEDGQEKTAGGTEFSVGRSDLVPGGDVGQPAAAGGSDPLSNFILT